MLELEKFKWLGGVGWVLGEAFLVELVDSFRGVELFGLPPLIVDFVEVLDRVDGFVRLGGHVWVYLWDKILAADNTYPWDVGRVRELVVAVGWVLRDYPLTDWELKRNERIVRFLGENRVFRVSDFQRYVWFEQVRLQEQRGLFYYRSCYIRNFCDFLFGVLEEKGFVRRVGLDRYLVLEVPSLDFINEVARRRIYDIWRP